MRIAIWHNLPSGGGKRALYYHTKGLVERGHHVEVWSPPTADHSYLPLNTLAREHVVPLGWQVASRAEGGIRSHRRLCTNLKALNDHCRSCGEQIEQGGFDILFANSCTYVRTSPIGRYVTIPKILYLQEPYRWLYEAMPTLPWLALPPPRRHWWSPRYLRWFLANQLHVHGLRIQAREEVRNAEAFDAILVNSYFSRESVLRAYGLDASVCYLGVDTGLFVDMDLPRENFVLGVGAFVPEKNIEFVIEALALVPQPRPRLIWVGNVGDAHYVSKLHALASRLEVPFEARIRVSDAEIVSLYNRAKLLLYAPRLEPFGFAPLEANSCGCPVVAVAEGGVRETVAHRINGSLVDAGSAAMASAVAHLLSDESTWRELHRRTRPFVLEHWSLEKSIDRLEARFENILSTGGAAV
ncbi:MAG: glycosyltransferase family 4 protein [Deltaproteobacteria bacterium]|nr:glycosyltransferase family 4 protein [Deltaproteobacteria bacterium]